MLCVFFQKKEKKKKEKSVITYDIPTKKGEKKGMLIISLFKTIMFYSRYVNIIQNGPFDGGQSLSSYV